ncbi:MAG: DNA gyrase subunit A [candidate division WOR-3 bacterium]|nr:DNA gyrase subunit A [candidate division WOR-3 bacterium]MCX7947256.1 DNA gyrase subunit A [candidate division WOR-3 bacterium]MDW8150187.1 DNA gyrase subunit A [candidate division WOR-3 bacterium]
MSKIVNSEFETELKESYLKYALSVIISRAIPDARDGLKPVQRRILYAMYDMNLLPNKPFRKSATVVGEVIGKYHPHGDQAVYEALVRLAQDFHMRYPLIEGQGNFGSIDGDPPAAYRYTEVRLEKIALELLNNIEENVVDFVDNFDGRYREPVLLPAGFPNLLVNGAVGIAVGMGTSIPPHNLSEIIDGTIALIDNPNITIEELLKYIKGPDFPTGGTIVGREQIYQAYKTGKGKITIRANYEIQDKDIIIKEIPYLVNKAELISKIAQLAREGTIEGISDIRDESDREGLRIVIEVKKGYEPQVVLNQLMKHTKLQDTLSINMIAILNNQPRTFNLKELLQVFIDYREEIIRRRTQFRLNKAKQRMHIIEGFILALENLDDIIETIRKSEDVDSAREFLITKYKLTTEQASAILDIKLQSLTKLETDKLLEEYRKLENDVKNYEKILYQREELLKLMKLELLNIKERFKDIRKTEIIDSEEDKISLDIENLIQREDILVLITKDGYIKRMPLKSFRNQKRGTKGKTGITTYQGDVPYKVSICNTHSQLLFITNKARAFWTKAYKIPEMSLSSKGKSINSLFNLPKDERVVEILPNEDSKYIVIITKQSRVKRIEISEVLKGRMGVPIMKLKEGDEIVSCLLTLGEEDILIAKEDGKVVRIKQNEIPIQSRKGSGAIGTRGENVIAACTILKNSKVITITNKGYGKKVKEEDIPVLKRGAKGVYILKTKEKFGKLVSVLSSFENYENLIIITNKGIILRIDVSELNEYSRQASGMKLIELQEDDYIACAQIIRGD